MKAAAAPSFICLFLLLLAGCSGTGRPASAGSEYTPLFAAVPSARPEPGTLKGDYDNAAAAKGLSEAAARWEQFLKQHKPANNEYEDAFQKRLLDSATYELVRVYYLLGDRSKGDQLLKDLDPLELR